MIFNNNIICNYTSSTSNELIIIIIIIIIIIEIGHSAPTLDALLVAGLLSVVAIHVDWPTWLTSTTKKANNKKKKHTHKHEIYSEYNQASRPENESS